MTQLNNRGIVAIVEIVVYIPLALLSVSLLIKYGFKREGWVYLLILSISTSGLPPIRDSLLKITLFSSNRWWHNVRHGLATGTSKYLASNYRRHLGNIRSVATTGSDRWLPWDSVRLLSKDLFDYILM